MPKDTGRGAPAETLAKAIAAAGGQAQLAARAGASEKAVSNWVRWGRVPLNRSHYVEAIANGVPGERDPRSGEWRSSFAPRPSADRVAAWKAVAPPPPPPAVPARPMLLTRIEVEELTGKQRPGAQRGALDHMGIRYGVRPDGSLVVLRDHVEQVLGLAETKPVEPMKREPQLRLEPRVRP